MNNNNPKVLCEDSKCGWHGQLDETLEAPHPFIKDEKIRGCPVCLHPQDFFLACDEPGCWRQADCGTPTTDGYRQTCGRHIPKGN